MSAYRSIKCNINEGEAIVEALIDMGFKREEIEVHEIAKNLKGYTGDTRSQKGHIIVRQKYVNKRVSGSASNDIGFEKVDGKYVARISSYDSGWWEKKVDRFMQVGAISQATRVAKKKGYLVTRKEVGNQIVIKCKKAY